LEISGRDIVAVILALAVIAAVVVTGTGRHLDDIEISLMDTIAGAVVGALATFIGVRNDRGKSGGSGTDTGTGN
jgi:NhaP-type Na+/H+ or K+/H+ antiporter